MRRLYHYTSIERWALIEQDGYLRPSESNLSATKLHAGPDVVWLTTDSELAHKHGLDNSLDGTDKTRIRITVDLPNGDVEKWKDWAIRRGIDRDWLGKLVEVAGGGAGTWRVTEKRISSARWVEVVDRATGEVLWSPH